MSFPGSYFQFSSLKKKYLNEQNNKLGDFPCHNLCQWHKSISEAGVLNIFIMINSLVGLALDFIIKPNIFMLFMKLKWTNIQSNVYTEKS